MQRVDVEAVGVKTATNATPPAISTPTPTPWHPTAPATGRSNANANISTNVCVDYRQAEGGYCVPLGRELHVEELILQLRIEPAQNPDSVQ